MFLSLHTLTSPLKLSCLSDAYTALNYMPFVKTEYLPHNQSASEEPASSYKAD